MSIKRGQTIVRNCNYIEQVVSLINRQWWSEYTSEDIAAAYSVDQHEDPQAIATFIDINNNLQDLIDSGGIFDFVLSANIAFRHINNNLIVVNIDGSPNLELVK